MLMSMNLLYEMDSFHLILQDRQVKWICGEMADAALISLENGSTWGGAGNLAEEILLRNTEGKNEEKTVWNMKKMGRLIQVKVTAQPSGFSLPFLDSHIHLSASETRGILSES